MRDAVAGSASDCTPPPSPGRARAARTPPARRDPGPARGEERRPGLVDEHEGERQQHRRQVQERGRRADAGELRDHRDRRMPERERVARVQAAVLELVHRAQRQVVQGEQLLHPGEVEERVAVVAGDPPERDPGHEPEREHPDRPERDAALAPGRERRRHERGRPAAARARATATRAPEHQCRRDEERGHRPRQRAGEPRTPSARLTNAPGISKHSVAAPSRRPRPTPSAGSSRESASTAGAKQPPRSFTGAAAARPGRAPA